ncbi:DUF2550 domain-containing protein [Microlunatus soli]|uniref:DUF2550 domain-containing protein n=1 Tax=Microlunatus soli TaxID=630515 RepID=A0A1H1ZWT1_9ACTN|nr:DUF2550 domain-containing protein [Microlunatus soli]SDT37716.1 Protein of unknown function [Microlunatus soli]
MVFGWLSALEVIGVILVLLGLCLVGLAVRRRWLARNGGTFECSMSRHVVSAAAVGNKPTSDSSSSDDTTPSPRWVLGVARYSGENFEWFRFFSLAWWPKYTFLRSQVSVLDHRLPAPSEAVALYADQEIVTVSIGTGDRTERRQLAMTPESLTGMMSWLEAAPPGIGRY